MKPFRLGVNVWSAPSRAEWADKARKLEDLGYSALTVPDHLADLFPPMPALVAAAQPTNRPFGITRTRVRARGAKPWNEFVEQAGPCCACRLPKHGAPGGPR